MNDTGSMTEALRGLRAGDRSQREEAARRIFDRYFQELVRYAEDRLSPRIRRRVGPEDVAQSALKSFFRSDWAGRFILETRDDLEKVLFRLTLRKAQQAARKHTAAKRDVGCEVQGPVGSSSQADELAIPGDVFEHMASNAPTAEEAAWLREATEAFPENLREVFGLMLGGYSNKEIGGIVERSAETVRLQKIAIASELKKFLGDETA